MKQVAISKIIETNPEMGYDKVSAVKGLRTLTGLGLREAKEEIERVASLGGDSRSYVIKSDADTPDFMMGRAFLEQGGFDVFIHDVDETERNTLIPKLEALTKEAIDARCYDLAIDIITVLKNNSEA